MVDVVTISLSIAGTILLLLMSIVAIFKLRYKIYTNRDFVLFFRRGKLLRQGYGGAYFVWPILDEIIVLSTTIQTLEIQAEQVITSENQDVRITGFVVWRIEDPVKAYQSIKSSQNLEVMTEINVTLSKLVEAIIRTTVARLSLDQILRERTLILEAIMGELLPVVEPLGLVINTSEIRHVDVVDNKLFFDLQETYRQEARLVAEKVKIDTEREIEKSQAKSTQDVRIFTAEQVEAASLREIARDKAIVEGEQQKEVSQKKKEGAVLIQDLENKVLGSKKDKEKLQVEAETNLMQIEIQAEAKKKRLILEEIQVEAEKRKLLAEAEAEAIKMKAEADKESKELAAEAEAMRITKIAEATKKSLLAEAEGKKAVLLAEAEGLREKVKAQGYVNEAMIMQELIQQLPSIASSIKVGEVNWLNMGGKGNNGESPLGIIPKNMLEIMALSKTFGLDIENLLSKIRGKPIQGTNDSQQVLVQQVPEGESPAPLTNTLKPVFDDDGKVVAVTLGDDDHRFDVPEGINVLVNDQGEIKGVDINDDGIPEIEDLSQIVAMLQQPAAQTTVL